MVVECLSDQIMCITAFITLTKNGLFSYHRNSTAFPTATTTGRRMQTATDARLGERSGGYIASTT